MESNGEKIYYHLKNDNTKECNIFRKMPFGLVVKRRGH